MKQAVRRKNRKLIEPLVLKLLRRRRLLRNVVNAIPDGDAPNWSQAFKRYEELAAPFLKEISQLTKRIGQRPAWWKPRPKTKEDYQIERQYAAAATEELCPS